jgi:hypothetical protein
MGYGKIKFKMPPLFLKKNISLWSDAFGFWPVWSFSGSSAVMVRTFVYPH